MLNRKSLIIILIAIIIISLSTYLFLNQKNNNIPEIDVKTEETEDFIEVEEAPVKIEQGVVSGIQDGKREWKIEAEKISLGKDRKNTIFEEIKNIVIFKDEEPHLNIRAEKCIADMQSKNMELIGDVVIETKEGDLLRGMGFFWDSMEETLSSTAPVEILSKNHIISADRFFSDTELNILQLEGNAEVILQTDS